MGIPGRRGTYSWHEGRHRRLTVSKATANGTPACPLQPNNVLAMPLPWGRGRRLHANGLIQPQRTAASFGTAAKRLHPRSCSSGAHNLLLQKVQQADCQTHEASQLQQEIRGPRRTGGCQRLRHTRAWVPLPLDCQPCTGHAAADGDTDHARPSRLPLSCCPSHLPPLLSSGPASPSPPWRQQLARGPCGRRRRR